MATYIKSVWRMTWDPAGTPLVMLDYGDRMLAEPLFGQVHSSELVSFARADNPVGFHHGNVAHNLTFSRVVEHASIAAARASMLSHFWETGDLRVAQLRIEILDGSVTDMQKSVILDVAPEMGPDLGSAGGGKHRVVWTYSVAGGKLI